MHAMLVWVDGGYGFRKHESLLIFWIRLATKKLMQTHFIFHLSVSVCTTIVGAAGKCKSILMTVKQLAWRIGLH